MQIDKLCTVHCVSGTFTEPKFLILCFPYLFCFQCRADSLLFGTVVVCDCIPTCQVPQRSVSLVVVLPFLTLFWGMKLSKRIVVLFNQTKKGVRGVMSAWLFPVDHKTQKATLDVASVFYLNSHRQRMSYLSWSQSMTVSGVYYFICYLVYCLQQQRQTDVAALQLFRHIHAAHHVRRIHAGHKMFQLREVQMSQEKYLVFSSPHEWGVVVLWGIPT